MTPARETSRGLRAWLGRLVWRGFFRVLRWSQTPDRTAVLHGVPFSASFLADDDEAARAMSKVAAALDLIAEHAPHTLRHVQTCLTEIVVFGSPHYVGLYVDELRLCLLNHKKVLSDVWSPPAIAMTIVHEATHGRLHRLGIHLTPENRIRVERVCVKAEIILAARLPDGEAFLEWAEKVYDDAESIWSPERKRQNRFRALRQLGCPRWLATAVNWAARR